MNFDSGLQQIFTKARRFTVSGIFATGIHVLLAVFLIKLLGADPSIANGIAFLLATIFSYTVNTLWSFSSSLRSANLIRFALVSFIGGIIAMIVSDIAHRYGLNYLHGIMMVAIAVPPITFILHNFWTYR
jgi:putative flippase GtrA